MPTKSDLSNTPILRVGLERRRAGGCVTCLLFHVLLTARVCCPLTSAG